MVPRQRGKKRKTKMTVRSMVSKRTITKQDADKMNVGEIFRVTQAYAQARRDGSHLTEERLAAHTNIQKQKVGRLGGNVG